MQYIDLSKTFDIAICVSKIIGVLLLLPEISLIHYFLKGENHRFGKSQNNLQVLSSHIHVACVLLFLL